MALNSLYCADVPWSNYSLTHSLTLFEAFYRGAILHHKGSDIPHVNRAFSGTWEQLNPDAIPSTNNDLYGTRFAGWKTSTVTAEPVDWEFKFYEFWKLIKFTNFFFMNFKTVIFKFIKFKLSHSSPPSSSKCTDANTALNFLIKKILWCQQFKICQLSNGSAWSRAAYYKVYKSPAASLSSPVSESESSTAHCSHSTVASV